MDHALRWPSLVFALVLASCAEPETQPMAASKSANQTVTKQVDVSGIEPMKTAHFAIYSTADKASTQIVADAVEALHASFVGFFEIQPSEAPLKIRLYANQTEFKKNNLASPWAEAFYLGPYSHAYVEPSSVNAHHWMTHEVVHQLSREVARYRRVKWVDEGLATYFAASVLTKDGFALGRIDRNAYPIWWLDDMALSGSLSKDVEDGKIIPLEAIVSGSGGPDINQHVNTYYLHYWSLIHYLLHADNGRHAEHLKAMIGGSSDLSDFESRFGPIRDVEAGWYRYLLELSRLQVTEVIVQ